jgi:hypothetical protein
MAAHSALQDGMQGARGSEWQPPSQRAQRHRPPAKPVPVRVAAKLRVRCVALLGIVVPATTFVALLAIIAILPATRLMEDLFSVSANMLHFTF